MKKETLFKFAAVDFVVAIAAVTAFGISTKSSSTNLLILDVEALTGCEITKSNGDVIFSYSGEKTCSETYLGRTLTCDGTKN